MNLRQLEIFSAVMQAGTITGAARMLNLTQPAVSKLLQHTEDQLGIPLFRRIGGRLRPTPEALALFPEVDRVFSRLRVVRQMTADLRRNVWGRISLATPVTLGTTIVCSAIARFRTVQPEVSFTVHALPNQNVVGMVVDGEAEIGVVVAPFTHVLTTAIELFKAEVVCVLPPDHALAGLQTIMPKDLRGHTVITGYGGHRFGAMLDAAFGSANELLDVPLQVTNSIIACGLVAGGAGVALTDPFAVRRYFPHLLMKTFRPKITLNPQIIHRSDRPPSRVALAFTEMLRDEMGMR